MVDTIKLVEIVEKVEERFDMKYFNWFKDKASFMEFVYTEIKQDVLLGDSA